MSKQGLVRTDDPWLPYLLRLERLAWRMWLATVAVGVALWLFLAFGLWAWWVWVFYPLLARR